MTPPAVKQRASSSSSLDRHERRAEFNRLAASIQEASKRKIRDKTTSYDRKDDLIAALTEKLDWYIKESESERSDASLLILSLQQTKETLMAQRELLIKENAALKQKLANASKLGDANGQESAVTAVVEPEIDVDTAALIAKELSEQRVTEEKKSDTDSQTLREQAELLVREKVKRVESLERAFQVSFSEGSRTKQVQQDRSTRKKERGFAEQILEQAFEEVTMERRNFFAEQRQEQVVHNNRKERSQLAQSSHASMEGSLERSLEHAAPQTKRGPPRVHFSADKDSASKRRMSQYFASCPSYTMDHDESVGPAWCGAEYIIPGH